MQITRPNEFIALIAVLTAMVAMSIDTMLPAVGTIATELHAANPNDRQFIVLFFFLGLTFGQLIFGPMSDAVDGSEDFVAAAYTRVDLDHVGHFPQEEDPDAFDSVLLEWLHTLG